ncbi:Hypothetical protein CINCED_3A005211 [Cinara cedri]|uniref:Winged helix-turn-helix DNA-binding domain n=1 Tax=Cinara cedri TaxID=506608 RepID=A0A5E4MHI5_9HEMI|nr:Hypothetical protein CINCED_3A005211 [Cinara cedri]
MIVNYYKQLIFENETIKYRDLTKHIADTLGVGLNKVQTTVSEYKQSRTVTSINRRRKKPGVVDTIDDFDKTAIHRKSIKEKIENYVRQKSKGSDSNHNDYIEESYLQKFRDGLELYTSLGKLICSSPYLGGKQPASEPCCPSQFFY